jgi:methionyl-tRNA synthetase
MNNQPFYITTTLPYVNADPHVGFAMEIIRADAIARYQTLQGREVFFNTGTDEHGQKLFDAAAKNGEAVQTYVDRYAASFRNLKPLLHISDDVHFIRTTDAHHEAAAQELWRRVRDNGYIYKKNYQAKYCVGCELEKTDSELNDEGRCPIHPDRDIQLIDEENYFFAFKKVEPLLKELYEKNPTLVIPDFRFNEMKAFLARGLEDFSISRLKSKMSWGVPVPDDEDHVMYVWFDALTNYISTLGWPEDAKGDYKKFWKEGIKVQYCGKDNVRQQSMMWQAMLLAAGLPTTDHIIINGFINSGGQKMSKSLGNVLSPAEIIDMFTPVAGELASDVLRYYLLRHVNSFEDSDMTIETVREAYTSGLANGLGNLVSRIMTMAENSKVSLSVEELEMKAFDGNSEEGYKDLENFEINKFVDEIFNFELQTLDAYIQREEPFKKIKVDEDAGKKDIHYLLFHLYGAVLKLAPILPKTSEKIIDIIKAGKKPETPLFQRL